VGELFAPLSHKAQDFEGQDHLHCAAKILMRMSAVTIPAGAPTVSWWTMYAADVAAFSDQP
jgi:hypothetical protein